MSRRKGNDSKRPSVARCSPSASLTLSSSPASGGAFNSLSQTYGLPAPSTGSLLVRFTSLHIKLALKGDSSRARPVGDAARFGEPFYALHNLSRSPAHTPLAYFTLRSNISLRVSAISPCVSRISPRAKVRLTRPLPAQTPLRRLRRFCRKGSSAHPSRGRGYAPP